MAVILVWFKFWPCFKLFYLFFNLWPSSTTYWSPYIRAKTTYL